MHKLVLKTACLEKNGPNNPLAKQQHMQFVHIYFCGISALSPLHVAKL